MKVELTDEQLSSAVRTIVDEEMPEAVREIVRRRADSIIKERVDARIGAVVDEMLANEQFVSPRPFANVTLDLLVKRAVSAYLDEPVYLYSKTDDRPSVRFTRCSSGSGPARLEAFLHFVIEKFCDEHLAAKLEATAKQYLEARGGIEKVAREQMAQLLKEKFKL